MNKTLIGWVKNPDGKQGRISPEYIAGFFDGEGSAMVLTIRRKLNYGLVYRFRPVIKIHQKTPIVLVRIMNYMGDGHIDEPKGGYCYIINSLGGVMRFAAIVESITIVKHDSLKALHNLALFQWQKKRRNEPYTEADTIKLLDLRDCVFASNCVTRTGLSQKYARDRILSETTFIEDIVAWKYHRYRGLRQYRREHYAQK